jgi:hypothetical protein
MDVAEVFDVLGALPDGAGHEMLCDALRESAGLPECPSCSNSKKRVAGPRSLSLSH